MADSGSILITITGGNKPARRRLQRFVRSFVSIEPIFWNLELGEGDKETATICVSASTWRPTIYDMILGGVATLKNPL